VSLRFLLDTNVLSEPMRPRPDRRILRRLEEHQGESAIAAPVWHEALFGWERLPGSRRKERLGSYLFDVVRRSLPILTYDALAAAWHAAERARLQAKGRTLPFVDGQIAAIARVNDLTLVTANGSDFADFAGVRLEDWTV
jgi:tRNA(fMet)-specific endonuclease VapC